MAIPCQCSLPKLLSQGCQCGAFALEQKKPASSTIWGYYYLAGEVVTTDTTLENFPPVNQCNNPNWSMTLSSGTYQVIFAAQVEGYGWLYVGENKKPVHAAHVFKTAVPQSVLLTADITIPQGHSEAVHPLWQADQGSIKVSRASFEVRRFS